MYQHWTPRGQGEGAVVEQLVLPKQYQKAVLQLAHTIPLRTPGGEDSSMYTAVLVLASVM